MENNSNPWSVFFAILLAALVIGGGLYLWQNQAPAAEPNPVEDIVNNIVFETVPAETETETEEVQ